MHQFTPARPQPAAPLAIEVRPERDRVVVAAEGELDLATSGLLASEVGELMDRGFAAIVLDLRGVTFLDSSGLRLLIGLDDRARREDRALELTDADGPVRRLLELTGMRSRFTMTA